MKKGQDGNGVGKSKSTPPQNQKNPPRRILVVNGNDDLLQLSTEVLIRSGYEAHAASDSAAAWKALNKNRYDLLITDYEVPKLSGVLGYCRSCALARMAVPVIVATAIPPSRLESIRHPWLQPAAMLIMPYTVSEFLGTVQEVLRVSVDIREPEARLLPKSAIWPSA